MSDHGRPWAFAGAIMVGSGRVRVAAITPPRGHNAREAHTIPAQDLFPAANTPPNEPTWIPVPPDEPHTLRMLITAGPTYEPIDAVRFIGNRSSGRLGSALADHAARAGWRVRLLLGPNAIEPSEPGVDVVRFRSAADLGSLLAEHLPDCDVLIMAAAVADYRPDPASVRQGGKHRRSADSLVLRLEPTPDLLAGCAAKARPDQLLVGFALEPESELLASAHAKLQRKSIDLILANPLETMESPDIHARLIGNPDRGCPVDVRTDGPIPKGAFAGWLLEHITPLARSRAGTEPARGQA